MRKNMPNVVKYIDTLGRQPVWDKAYNYEDGKLMAIPTVTLAGAAKQVFAARQDWLDNTGINKLSETIDELYDILKAFTFTFTFTFTF